MPDAALLGTRSLLTSEGLSITDITGRPPSLGKVGLACSGGGSRAAMVALGVVRFLHHVDLLRHVRALSCVSGGGWFSVPFTFLPGHIADEEFLGTHVEDTASLRLEAGDDPTCLRSLADGHFGVPLTRRTMNVAVIVAKALEDHRKGVPSHRLWSREVGLGLLDHFGLASFGDDHLPVATFGADEGHERSMRIRCPSLERPCHLVRSGDYLPRPYLIVNGSMRVKGHDGADVLAPVQFTPYFSGVMGTGIGTLANREVGGGGISSYAFGGDWLEGPRERMKVRHEYALALSDIVGISSAAYADALADKGIGEISPMLNYVSPLWEPPVGIPARFADGGSVENTGVPSLLAYEDIDTVIAAVASPKGIDVTRRGQVIVERQIPALFGLREYNRDSGYVPYAEPGEGNPDYADNQVFANDAGQFDWLAEQMGARHEAGEAIVVEQSLTTVRNDKYAVRGGREVRVLWLFSSPAKRWREQLPAPLRLTLPPSFPNVPTARTQLDEVHINLLSHFHGWMLDQNRETLAGLFRPDP